MDRLVIVTSFDANYYPDCTGFVASFAENYHRTTPIDFYCLVPTELMDKEQEFISAMNVSNKLNIKFVNSEGYNKLLALKQIKGSHWITPHAFHRLFLSSVCADFDRAIYIDCDTLVLRDIEPLLSLPMSGKIMAFTEMNRSTQGVFPEEGRPYFNAGVFVTDLNYWRENDLENKMVQWIETNGVTEFLEQDILNRFFNDVLYPLHVIFNFFYYIRDYPNLTSPIIVHFIGPNKPWNSPDDKSEYYEKWRGFRASKSL